MAHGSEPCLPISWDRAFRLALGQSRCSETFAEGREEVVREGGSLRLDFFIFIYEMGIK